MSILSRLVVAVWLAAALPMQAEDVSERLLAGHKSESDWLSYGRSYKAWRYSPLDQINRENVGKLSTEWAFQTGVIQDGFQTTPLVADGVMYLTSSFSRVFAVDAKTGEELWHYYAPRPDAIKGPSTLGNRGAAIGHGLVFVGTMHNLLIALDAKSGREVWRVEVEAHEQCGCGITGAPLVVKDKVIVGVTGGDSAHRGYLNGFDAKTGRHVWRFWTIPGPGEPGNETWKGDSWMYGGGGTWLTGSYDPALDLVYWGVGNPAADFYGEDREGDNLYTNSVVAIDPDDGKLAWHYQLIPYDVWDFDAAYESILLDLEYKGDERKILINPNKSGYVWILDRTTGEFLHAWPLVENINFIQGIDEDGNLVGRNEPEVGVTTTICPAIGGGRQWNHAAYSPRTNWLYSTGIEWCQTLTVRPELPREGELFFGGEFFTIEAQEGETGGHLGAYDPLTGDRKWIYKSRYPLLASQLATAGDLVFTGDALGKFFALDAETGEELWSFRTGSGHRGSPMSYSVDGRQYIAMPSGWGSAAATVMSQLYPEAADFPPGSTLFVFTLPEDK